MIQLDIEQRTAEWYAARCGIPTASCFDKIVTSKGEPSKQALKYMYQLAAERITGAKEEGYSSPTMELACVREEEARQFYELVRDTPITKVGLCYPDETKRFGASPDGLVGEDGLVQIKCPLAATHIAYLLDGSLPTEYVVQVQGEMLVTGRKWNDFVSYFPGLKPFIVRVERDKDLISKLGAALDSFCAELDKVVERISA